MCPVFRRSIGQEDGVPVPEGPGDRQGEPSKGKAKIERILGDGSHLSFEYPEMDYKKAVVRLTVGYVVRRTLEWLISRFPR